MRRPEPEGTSERKQAYFAQMGALASRGEFRSIGLKSFEAWNQMFPTMFEGALSNTPAISETSAQRIATVFTCLNIRGETLGFLPFSSKKNTPTGPQTEYGNLHRLIHDRPNPDTTAFDFWSTIEKWKLAWGNACAEIIRSNADPVRFDLLEPWEMTFKISNGQVFYFYKNRPIRSTDILHFKNYSIDGKLGISSIRQNALTMSSSLKLTQYNNSIIGERPYGYLTSETRPKDLQQKANQRSLWDKRGTASDEVDESKRGEVKNIAGIPYLYGGLKFQSFTLPADDVAYIESAKLKDQDIYGIFRVPPTLAGNYEKAPYNSSEQQDIVFAKYTLASLKEIEQECTEKLYPESNKLTQERYTKFSLNGLLRGDMNTRKEFYSSGIQNGWLTPNQVCELEDIPTYGKAGDQHFVQGALVPVEMIADMIKSKASAPTNQTRESIISELREKIRPKLNGHYADIEEFLN